jgi:hypothetical protein
MLLFRYVCRVPCVLLREPFIAICFKSANDTKKPMEADDSEENAEADATNIGNGYEDVNVFGATARARASSDADAVKEKNEEALRVKEMGDRLREISNRINPSNPMFDVSTYKDTIIDNSPQSY